MLKIFIAGPYTGDEEYNVARSIDVTNKLIKAGFAPFNPLLYHYCDQVTPQPYETWMNIDRQFLLACDAMLRISGESKGADREEQTANDHGIPVFYHIESLKSYSHWMDVTEND